MPTQHTTWIMGGVAVLLGCVAAKVVTAAPKRNCEEWRDYNFNVETGDFIEWAGDPYWICFDTGVPEERVTRPKSPDPDRYAGGVPFPETPTRAKKCTACKNRYKLCSRQIQQGMRDCRSHYYKHFAKLCTDEGRNRDDTRIKKDVQCTIARDSAHKPVEVCIDFAIDNCVAGYRRDQPAITTETERGIDLTAYFPRVGEASAKLGDKTSISWPSGRGYRTMCNQAGAAASEICVKAKSECFKQVGGCR